MAVSDAPASRDGCVDTSTPHAQPPDASLDTDNIWGLAVRFRSAEVELRYQTEALRAKLRHDAQVHVHGLFPGWLLVFRYWQSLSWFGVLMLLSVSLITAPACLFACLRRRALYSRFRTPILIFVNLHSISMFFCLIQEEIPEPLTKLSLLGMIGVKSPIAVGVYFSLNGNLPLKHNLVLQALATPMFLMWASSFCKAVCCCGSQARQLFDEFAAIINVMVLAMSNATVRQDMISCMVVVSWIVLFLGVLVPFAVAYNLDVMRRRAFVSRCYSMQMSFDFEQSVSYAQAAMWYLVILIQSIWVVCSLIFDIT